MKNLCNSCILCCALLAFAYTVIVEILPIKRKHQTINQSNFADGSTSYIVPGIVGHSDNMVWSLYMEMP